MVPTKLHPFWIYSGSQNTFTNINHNNNSDNRWFSIFTMTLKSSDNIWKKWTRVNVWNCWSESQCHRISARPIMLCVAICLHSLRQEFNIKTGWSTWNSFETDGKILPELSWINEMNLFVIFCIHIDDGRSN